MTYTSPRRKISLRDLLERLRFTMIMGLVRLMGVTPAHPELIVFRTQRDAREAGFKGQRHPHHRHLTAYWPGLGIRGLLGVPTQCRITIPYDLLSLRTPDGRLEDLLRSRQCAWGDQAIWISI